MPKWGVGGRQNSREKSRGGRGQGYQESESINKYNQKPRVSPIQKCMTMYDNSIVVIDHEHTRRKNMEANWKAVDMMCREGSGFESRLGDLWMHCDLGNRTKLERAFAETFNKFEDRYERHLEIMVEAEANR